MTATTAATSLLAALSWDPQIRGFSIVVTAFLILVGSVYLLLATNTGAKLGFLLAAAGFTGWCALMGWVWVIYGIGIKGEEPHWEVQEVITGDLRAQSAVDATEDFPQRWERMEAGNPLLGDAVSVADRVLAPQTGGGGHGEEEGETPASPPVFESAEDYTLVAGYRVGGEDYFLPGGLLKRSSGFLQGWLHSTHYAVVQVRPVIPPAEIGGPPPTPVADPSKPITNVVMVRNLGDLRVPSAFFGLANTIAFAVLCVVLHRRDKALMAARGAAAPAVG